MRKQEWGFISRGPGDMEQEEVAVFAVTALFIVISLEDDPPKDEFFFFFIVVITSTS